jgi:hypothetical protein
MQSQSNMNLYTLFIINHRRLWSLYDIPSDSGLNYLSIGSTVALFDQAFAQTITTTLTTTPTPTTTTATATTTTTTTTTIAFQYYYYYYYILQHTTTYYIILLHTTTY